MYFEIFSKLPRLHTSNQKQILKNVTPISWNWINILLPGLFSRSSLGSYKSLLKIIMFGEVLLGYKRKWLSTLCGNIGKLNLQIFLIDFFWAWIPAKSNTNRNVLQLTVFQGRRSWISELNAEQLKIIDFLSYFTNKSKK